MNRALVAISLMSAASARASCPPIDADWTVLRGDLAPGVTCGTLVLTTDAGDSRFYNGGSFWHYSVGRAARRELVHIPYELAFDVERVTPGRWWLELRALGVTVTVGNNTIAFITDSAKLATEFFDEHPELAAPGMHHVVLRQTAREVAVVFDGKVIEHRAIAASGDATVAVGLRGAPGERTRVLLRDVRVTPLR